MPTCPICASEMVYPLLNTLRCKRCKHIWKTGDVEYSTCRCPDLVPSLRVRKKTDPPGPILSPVTGHGKNSLVCHR